MPRAGIKMEVCDRCIQKGHYTQECDDEFSQIIPNPAFIPPQNCPYILEQLLDESPYGEPLDLDFSDEDLSKPLEVEL